MPGYQLWLQLHMQDPGFRGAIIKWPSTTESMCLRQSGLANAALGQQPSVKL